MVLTQPTALAIFSCLESFDWFSITTNYELNGQDIQEWEKLWVGLGGLLSIEGRFWLWFWWKPKGREEHCLREVRNQVHLSSASIWGGIFRPTSFWVTIPSSWLGISCSRHLGSITPNFVRQTKKCATSEHRLMFGHNLYLIVKFYIQTNTIKTNCRNYYFWQGSARVFTV